MFCVGGEMKIISDLPNYILNKIRKLVEDGKYQSISNFLVVAAENQLTIESDDLPDIHDFTFGNPQEKTHKQDFSYNHPQRDIKTLAPFIKEESENSWDDWLWGQINRILPIKFATRVLAIETDRLGQFPKKDEFDVSASEMARNFGIFLEEQDEKLNKARDEKISTGFPISSKKESSLGRYKSHFIGYQRADGSLTGALFDLGLANLKEDLKGDLVIGLTDSGLAFSKIDNPVLDLNNFNISLGNDEHQFYISHILKKVPGEVSLFKLLLELVNKGSNKREQLNEKLKKLVTASEWSDGMVSTQRAGAISRMYEIGLITKDRIGLEVRYLSTDFGNSFLRRVE